MSIKENIIYLESILTEAQQILSKNESLHNMHGHKAGIASAVLNYVDGITNEGSYNSISNLDLMIRQMRASDGKHKMVNLEKRKINRWLDVGS